MKSFTLETDGKPTKEYIINHNLNDRNPLIRFYGDDNNLLFISSGYTVDGKTAFDKSGDANTLIITFREEVEGIARILLELP